MKKIDHILKKKILLKIVCKWTRTNSNICGRKSDFLDHHDLIITIIKKCSEKYIWTINLKSFVLYNLDLMNSLREFSNTLLLFEACIGEMGFEKANLCEAKAAKVGAWDLIGTEEIFRFQWLHEQFAHFSVRFFI